MSTAEQMHEDLGELNEPALSGVYEQGLGPIALEAYMGNGNGAHKSEQQGNGTQEDGNGGSEE